MKDFLSSDTTRRAGEYNDPTNRKLSEEKVICMGITSDFSQVALVGVSLQAMCDHCGYTTEESGKIQIAVIEAINNIIEHAYEGKPAGRIDIEFHFKAQALEITLYDDGVAHHDAKLKERDPDLGVDPEDQDGLPEGGFGLMLMTMVMDRISRDRIGNRNRLSMTKWRKVDGYN